MNNYLKNIEIKDIKTSLIEDSKEYCLLYSAFDTNNSPLIFYFLNGKYYPSLSSINVNELKLSCNRIKAIISEDIESLVEFILLLRGMENLSFIDKLFLTKVSKRVYDSLGHNIKKYLPLLSLPDKAFDLFSKNKMSPDLGLKMLSYSNEDIICFIEITEKLKLSISLQKELFNYLSSQSKKNNQSFKNILDALTENSTTMTQENLFKKIRKKMMPEYTDCKEKFLQLKNVINLPQKINMIETPFFEDKNIKIEFFFKSLEELTKLITELKSNIDQKKSYWTQIFELL